MSLLDSAQGANPIDPDRPATFIHPSQRKTFDKDVTIEEYLHYAKLTRAEEEEENAKFRAKEKAGFLQNVFQRRDKESVSPPPVMPESAISNGSSEKDLHVDKEKGERRSSSRGHLIITNDEWANAARAMRTASAYASWCLIVIDIIGPYGVAFAMG